MIPRQIGVEEARAFFEDKTQHTEGATPEMLPVDGIEYWACGTICGAFRLGPWPGVFMADYGVKPEGWGRIVHPARAILDAFWKEQDPQAICGWTDKSNRAAIAFARRVGFREVGEMPLSNGGAVVIQEWKHGY